MQNRQWWSGAVIYQVYPRSFFDSDGDGVGDLPGVTAKLDYIASLGVDAIWLSPFFRSPMRDFGYDVADHGAVDPVFGTLSDVDRLLARAHALGLRVIIDLVCGHTSDEHRWFQTSRAGRDGPHSDWYVWADAKPNGAPPNNWLSVFGGPAWRWDAKRRQYYLHHFLASQPSLNLRHPEVTEALVDVARFWLARGVDGFRLDAIDFLLHDPALTDNPPRTPPSGAVVKPFGLQEHLYDMMQSEPPVLLARLRALADARPGTLLLGEFSSQEGAYERIASHTGPEGLHLGYTLRPMRGGDAAGMLGRALGEIAEAGGGQGLCWAFSNHDAARVASRWGVGAAGHAASAQLLLGLLLSLQGTICLYQGEELGLTEARLTREQLRDPQGIASFPHFPGRDGSRTPLPWRAGAVHAGFTAGEPWLPLPAEHHPLSIDLQHADPAAPLQACRRLIAWRKAHPALRYGDLTPLDLPAPLIGFIREAPGERLVLAFNPSATPVRFASPLLGNGELCEDGFAGLVEGNMAVLPPWGALALSLAAKTRRQKVG
jgi:alpha-glucosidase